MHVVLLTSVSFYLFIERISSRRGRSVSVILTAFAKWLLREDGDQTLDGNRRSDAGVSKDTCCHGDCSAQLMDGGEGDAQSLIQVVPVRTNVRDSGIYKWMD